jgi:hypothetical protein
MRDISRLPIVGAVSTDCANMKGAIIIEKNLKIEMLHENLFRLTI